MFQIWLKFVPKGAMGNKSVLIQETSWHEKDDKPSAEPEIVPLHRQIYASPNLNMFRFENSGAYG